MERCNQYSALQNSTSNTYTLNNLVVLTSDRCCGLFCSKRKILGNKLTLDLDEAIFLVVFRLLVENVPIDQMSQVAPNSKSNLPNGQRSSSIRAM